MAGFSANDELVSKPSSVSWGSSDEPVTTTSTAPVGSTAHNVARTAGEAVLPTGFGLAGFAAGATVAAPYAVAAGTATAATGVGAPFAPIVAGAIELGGGLFGAFAASGVAKKTQDWMHAAFAPEDFKQRQIEKQQNETSTFLTELGVGLVGMSPKTAATAVSQGASKVARLASTPAGQRVVSGGLQGGIEAGTELASEGKVEPWKVATATAAGAAMPGFNVAGKIPFALGEKVGSKISSVLPGGVKPDVTSSKDGLPPKPPEGSTPEERAAYIRKLEEIKAKRDSESPLIEAAIRNKETGNIERMGPKHDQARKEETLDTHEQGFVTERGQFLTREEAVDHAKRTKQIPEDHVLENPPGELPGLHSGDLRKAGDKRFEITDEQPAGVAKPPVEDAALKSREDFKSAISKNENQRIDLELEAEKAASVGNEERVTSINEQIKTLEAEHSQLHQDIPQVKFADPSKPTWEELQDHLWQAKTVGEAFDRLSSLKELGKTKQLLLKALNQSEFIRNAKLELSNKLLTYTDANGVEKNDAAGLYRGDEHKIQLGATGDVRVLLHEAMHAGTQRLLDAGNTKAAQELQRLYTEFTDHQKAKYQQALDAALKEHGALTPKEYSDLQNKHLHYGLTNVHEFVAEAFTNKKFQSMLKEIKTGERQKSTNSVWGKFVEAVREGLNIPEGARTALDDVMEHGISAIKKSKDFTSSSDITATGVPSKTTGSPDELPVDKTKTDPRDVKDEQEFYEIATDIYEKYGDTDAVKFYEGYKEYKQTWLEPIKETEKFVGINIKNKLANDRIIHNEMTKMAEAITDPARREAIAEAVDSGDLSKLSDAEKVVANRYSELVKDIGDRAVEQGVVKGLLEDYVTHIIDWTGAPKGAREEFVQALLGTAPRDPSMKGMTTESKFGKERKFKTFADLEWYINEANSRIQAAGKSDFRLKIKTKDIAEIYKEYATSMEKAIENKKLVDNLKQIRNVAGETLIKEINKDNPMPYGWQMMDSPQFAGYAVHPDMMPALKFVFDAGPGDLMKALGAISQLTKRINVIGSFFHAKSLMEVMSSAQIPIWTPVKEAIVLPLIEKGVKAITGKDLQLSAISKAVEQFKNGGLGDNVDMWIKEGGLQLEMPEDVTKGILSATGKFADQMIGKFGPKTRVLESTMSTVEKYTLGLFDKYTWDYLHTGGKLMVANAYLDKARMQAAKEGKPFDEKAARVEISRFVNDSFGGLNWFDAATSARTEMGKRISMAAYSPKGRRGLQIALFAPDWTISTLRAFTAALPKDLNPAKWSPVEGVKGMRTPTTKADYARLYQFKTALTYLTLINAINMMTANRPVWENKDPTRIEWPDGTSMQAMKHAMEPYHWIMDPDKTLSNKLGFIPKAAIIGIAGTEYASPQAQKLVDPSATGRLKAVAGTVVPFQVAASRDAPPGEGAKRAILGTAGFPVYGATAEQKKAARAEREKALKQKAKEYHEKAKQRGWEK